MEIVRVVTGKVRFSFLRVFEPEAAEEGGTPKYTATVMIPKEDTATLAKIKKAITNAAEAGKAKFGGKIPKNLKLPLNDGDDKMDDYPEFEGVMTINAKSTRRPQVVDKDVVDIIDPDEVYSGMYGRCGLTFYAYNHPTGGKGISAALDTVQKLEDGERLGAPIAKAEDDFATPLNSLF